MADPHSFRLLNGQKEQIARVMAKHGFHPANEFAWGTRNAGEFSGWNMEVPTVFHRPSGYFCSFSPGGHEPTGYDIQFSPTHDGYIGSVHVEEWVDALHIVERWVVALAYELRAVDPWADLAAHQGLLVMPSADQSENTPFTRQEISELTQRLGQLRSAVEAAGALAAPHLRAFDAFVEHQKTAATRLGRIDWANQFVGGLVSFVTTLALSPEARTVVLNAATVVGGWLSAGFHLLH